MYSLDVYDSHFYSNNQAEGLRHAEWFMPLLVKMFNPKSLVDVGCGTGHFGQWLCGSNIEYLGVEGSEWAYDNSIAPLLKWDLREPFRISRKFDLAISIEVAEHIEGEYAGTFVDTLCALSDTIVVTAAPPGQGGTMHVNEKPYEYWCELFQERGFEYHILYARKLLDGIQSAIDQGYHVATWFGPNIMCFRKVNVQA